MRVRGPLFLLLLIAALALLSTAGQLLGLYIDWLWFREVQFTSVFVTVLRTQVLLGVVTGAACFLLLYGNVRLARRLARRDVLVTVDDALRLPAPAVLESALRRLALPVSVAVALIVGWMGTGRWEMVLKALHPTPFGIQDPLFDQEVAFYVFQLPLWTALYGWLMGILIVSGLAAIVVYLCTRGIQVFPGGLTIVRRARGHLLVLAALLFLLKATGYWLAMFDLLFSQRGVAFGAGYADVHAQLPVLKALVVLASLVALLCLVTIRLRTWRPLLWGVAALVSMAMLGGGVYPGMIQRYQVSPNEIVTEKPYIDFNIRYTRLAYGLDNIEEREFPAEQTLTLPDLRRNDATLTNIRLWDTRPLLATYSQLQEIRTYYKFTDIDIDRYTINGEYRQVTLSPRELSAPDLPSRIWINERLTYTHGYGAVVSPVTRVTREGLPEFWVKDIPPVSASDLRITRPELYFSELATDYVFVHTRAKEFDYPAGNQNVYTTYEGQGGIALGSLWRKALFAAYLGDLKLLLSNDLTPESRVLLSRNIRERVQRIAPFFRYDDDPYIVISAAGRLVWLLDGYTVSDRFPYALPTRGLGNYVRNAVKVTVDAYDGTVHFYMAAAQGGVDDLAGEGLAAGRDDPEQRLTRQEARAREAPMRRVNLHLGSFSVTLKGVLAHRIGLTRERGFIHLEALTVQDNPIGWPGLAGSDDCEISWHDLRGGNGLGRSVTHHRGVGREAARLSLCGDVSTPMQEGVHADHGHTGGTQRQSFHVVAEKGIDGTGTEQEPDHGILGRVADEITPGAWGCFDDGVWPIMTQAFLSLLGGEAPLCGEQTCNAPEREQSTHHRNLVFSPDGEWSLRCLFSELQCTPPTTRVCVHREQGACQPNGDHARARGPWLGVGDTLCTSLDTSYPFRSDKLSSACDRQRIVVDVSDPTAPLIISLVGPYRACVTLCDPPCRSYQAQILLLLCKSSDQGTAAVRQAGVEGARDEYDRSGGV